MSFHVSFHKPLLEPNHVIEPYMFQPVLHHILDGPNSNRISFDSSPDKGDFNMESNWEHGLVDIFLLYFAFL